MEMIEMAVEDTYGRKGGVVVEMNINAARQTSEPEERRWRSAMR